MPTAAVSNDGHLEELEVQDGRDSIPCKARLVVPYRLALVRLISWGQVSKMLSTRIIAHVDTLPISTFTFIDVSRLLIEGSLWDSP